MTTETISLVKDSRSGDHYYQVENSGTGNFYLCNADGDQVQLAEWSLVRVLGEAEEGDSDAFFALVAASNAITYQIRRGHTWVDLDAEDVRWEVREEAESASESGETEVGGQAYRWAK